MRVTVVLAKRKTSPVANVNSNARPLRCRQVAWPSPTKRSTWHIAKSSSVAALRCDGGAGRYPTSSSRPSSACPEPLGPREIQPIGGRDREQASKRQRGPSRFGWERPTTTGPKAQYSQRDSAVRLAHWAIHPSRAAKCGTEHAGDFAGNCEHDDRPDGGC